MLNIKRFFIILAGVLFLSASAEARVCFLAGSDDASNCLTIAEFESSSCPGYTTCEIPDVAARSCDEGGVAVYKPEDCCTNNEHFEPCNGAGQICLSGTSCNGVDGNGETYTSCLIGNCVCDSSYSENCAGNGLEGVGEACDGLYQSCQCASNYYTCDAAATGGGSSCNDGTQKYTSCTCPTADGSEWVTDPDICCWGVSDTCTSQPSGDKVYKCRTGQVYDCFCGYSYDAGKTGSCKNGCTDDNYEYVGNIPSNATCGDFTLGIKGACGNNCYCNDGYWDFKEECSVQNENICAELGYTDTSCEGDWIACPYDVSAKKCLASEKEEVCTDGYAKTVEECGDRGAEAWTLEAVAGSSCGKCTPKACPSGSSTTSKTAKPGISEVVVTGYSGIEECTKLASCATGYAYSKDALDTGETLGTTYFGTVNGKKCYKITCASSSLTSLTVGKYATTLAGCGTQGAKGWKFNTTTGSSNLGCKLCVAQSCPTGYSPTRPLFCQGTVQTKGYSGDTPCTKCVSNSGGDIGFVKQCSSGCDYDCSNAGGPSCTSQSTYRGLACLKCAEIIEQ